MYGYVSAFGLFDGLNLGMTGTLIAISLEVTVALIVGYLLYWMVLRADPDYLLLASLLYLVLGSVNLLYALSCLWGGLELLHFALYMLKTLVSLGCAFYAAKIRERAQGGGGGGGDGEAFEVVEKDPAQPLELM